MGLGLLLAFARLAALVSWSWVGQEWIRLGDEDELEQGDVCCATPTIGYRYLRAWKAGGMAITYMAPPASTHTPMYAPVDVTLVV